MRILIDTLSAETSNWDAMSPMKLSPAVVGLELEPLQLEWKWRDAVLYALGVGAEPATELDYLYERRGPRVLPTFAVIAGTKMMDTLGKFVEVDLRRMLHGEESLTLYRPLPAQGSFVVRGRISELWDKGKAAVMGVETTVADDDGPLCRVHATLFMMGAGGFGGERGPSSASEPMPERAPDHVVRQSVPAAQAALYRLSGDRNPMHIDPEFATKAGFEGPFLHGLCTYGYVGRAALQTLCAGDPDSFRSFSCRFADRVWPGDTLVTSIWDVGDGEAALETSTDRGNVVLSQCRVMVGPPVGVVHSSSNGA